MLHLGLIGENISHSKSKDVYQSLLQRQIDYTLFDFKTPPKELKYYFDKVSGISITTPHKTFFSKLVQFDNEEVKTLNAINCIKLLNNTYIATNTDYLALLEILQKFLNMDIIILGNGVMSKIVQKILLSHSKDFLLLQSQFLRLNLSLDFSTIKMFNKKRVIINCCSRNFIFNGLFKTNDHFYDLNYKFPAHQEICKQQKIEYTDGIELLITQAKHSLKFWNFE